MNEIIIKSEADQIMEQVIAKGDLSKLTSDERNKYYLETCRSIGLNPLTRPFEYLVLNGKTVMYARRDAADQLRKIYGVDIQIIKQELQGDLFCVTVRATDKTGRADEDVGITVMPKAGANEIKANMILKAITKAKRRVTLSICGLGFMDESEVEDLMAAPKKKGAVRTVTSAELPQMVEEQSTSSRQTNTAAQTAASAFPEVPNDAAVPLSDIEQQLDEALAIAATNGTAALQDEWSTLHPNYQKKLKTRLDGVHKKVAALADKESATSA
jgi:hypothetical protein